ncbi:cytochrome b [Serratia sp. UGAL515B_01]|uniref:cytochrome b n=1 Tax=Serratia sp. UGAL515B_01 TaxID=2986763 RepID=UPI002952D0E5|nr:cytochrome b [Serratia sp. UGAL515B_01]WON76506.1 cytochrome b [Serratia sp. UGAL515B_01]
MTHDKKCNEQKEATDGISNIKAYHRSIRILHWVMAILFTLMWLSGIFVTNIEGVPYFIDLNIQDTIRDLHKSIGITLFILLVVRIGLRLITVSPPLPTSIPVTERVIAHIGHSALYITIILTCLAGLAISDLLGYGNAYFGIELPQIFPAREQLAGWAADPWSYVLHAVFAYGLLALVIIHVAAVWLHIRSHKVELLPRVLSVSPKRSKKALSWISILAGSFFIIIAVFAIRAWITQNSQEQARDYQTTTPFSKK